MDKKSFDRMGEVTDSLCIVGECEVIKEVGVLVLSSVWPGKIATTGEIADEHARVEMLHGCKIEVHEVTYPTFSGAMSTKVRWRCA